MSVTQHIPVGNSAVLLYTPATTGSPSVVLFNEGLATVFIGQSGVTSGLGLALPPNQRMRINPARFTLFGITSAAANVTTVHVEAAAN